MSQTKIGRSIGKKIVLVAVVILAFIVSVYLMIIVCLKINAKASKKTYTDISRYAVQRSSDDAIDNFSARGMDIAYEKYLPEGFDAATDNQTQQEKVKNIRRE